MRTTKRRAIILSIIVLILIKIGYLIYYDGPYWGKVIEYETGKPIQGAVVHMEWSIMTTGPGGVISYYLDSKETLTDKKGDFFIPPLLNVRFKPITLVSLLKPASLIIFKAGGYEAVDYKNYSCYYCYKLSNRIFPQKHNRLEGRLEYRWFIKAIFKVKRIKTREERADNIPTSPENIGETTLLAKENEKEFRALGLWH